MVAGHESAAKIKKSVRSFLNGLARIVRLAAYCPGQGSKVMASPLAKPFSFS